MKTKLIAATGLLVMICLFSFASPLNNNYKGEPFTKLQLKISGNVILSQGNDCSVKIEAPADIADEIVTEVTDNGTLVIKYKSKLSWNKIKNLLKKNKVLFYVTMEEIAGLAISGSGDIIAKTAVKSDDLGLKISGSGDISLNELKADELAISISGSGNVKIGDGGADELMVAISGSGDVAAGSFGADEASIKIAGSGDCQIGKIDELSVSIAGSGDVSYKGEPDISKKISGSGSVKRVK